MLSKGISRNPFFRPHAFDIYGLRYFALKAASSVPASELRLETASLNAIAASKKKTAVPRKKKLDSVNTLLTSNSVPGAQINHVLALKAAEPILETASFNAIAASMKKGVPKKAAPKKKKLDEQINQFPVYSYKHCEPLPTVVYIQQEEEANRLITKLKAGPVAFDLEWRLMFKWKNAKIVKVDRRTAVVQLADSSGLILVIQIYDMSRFPIELQSLLENPDIPKFGVNILNDGQKLFRDFGILAQNLVELGALALLADPVGSTEKRTTKRKMVSLVKLVEWYCGMELVKGKERKGNWELNLEEKQIDYAANDVHASMAVYQKLCSIAQLNAITLTDNTSAFTSDVKPPSPEDIASSSKDIVISPSSEVYQNLDQPKQSRISVYGRVMRAVLGFKALLRTFFVKR